MKIHIHFLKNLPDDSLLQATCATWLRRKLGFLDQFDHTSAPTDRRVGYKYEIISVMSAVLWDDIRQVSHVSVR